MAVSIPTFVQGYAFPQRVGSRHATPRALLVAQKAPLPYPAVEEKFFRGFAFAVLFEFAFALLVFAAWKLL